MARDYYNEVTNKNSFSKNTQKKKKKNEKETEVVKKPQSSVSTKQPVRQTGTGSRRTASVSRGSQQAANQVANAASQVMQRRSDRNKPAQTAKEMQQQRKGVAAAIEQKQSVQNKLNTNRLARTEAEEAKKKNYAEWETVKNKSKQDQQAWFTEKAKETADRHNIKGTDNLATSSALAGFHGAKGAVHSLSGALERASMNDTAEAYKYKFDEMRKGKSEDIAEKIGAEKAQKRQEARLAGYREKTKIEQQKIEELKAQEEERDNLKFTIGGKEYSPRKMTVGAATFTGQRLVDSATGPYSLLSMGARVLEDERNSGKERNDQLKQKLAESGQFSQEELDEQFAQLDKRAVANAYASSAIEILSELMFQGVGLSKKYIPEGASGLLDKVAGKLFGRLGSTAAGRIGLGIGEETLEEWIANPIQAKVSNMLTGNTLQSLQEESVRKTYQEQARSLEEIQATSADINSEAFLEKAKEVYKEAGATDAEASQIAELARDYFNAEITGDSSTAEEKLNEITNILAGGENDLREKWTLQDALEVAGEMIISVGAEAAPGAISMSQTGGQHKANYGIEGVRKLAKVVENLDDEKSDRAKAIIDDIDNGKDVSNTQVAMLMEWSNNAALKAQDREITRDQVVQRRMRDEKLYVPIVDAEYNLAPATEARFEEITETVADLAQEALNMSDVDAYAIGDVVAAYETGTISAEQMNELNIENPENRAVFEKATGIDLGQYTIKDAAGNVKVAASNTAMQKALFAKAADNYIESAKIEQENWNDVERGQAYERLTSDNMGGRGDMAIDKVLSSVDPRNRGEFMLAGSVARRVYEHARLTNDSWDEVKKDFTNTFGPAMTENMKYVYEMAKADKAIGETKNYGKKVNAGENMKNGLGDDRVVIVPGKVIDERQNQKLSDKSFAMLIATTFGKDVKLVDNLPLVDNKGRVVYKNNQNGERIDENRLNELSEEERIYYSPVQVEGSQSGTAITINMHPDIFRDWKEVLGHEAFHQIRENAPEEVKIMAQILMDRLYKADPEGFTQMLNAKIEQYKVANPEITAEEAFEEILANNFADIDWNQLVEDIKADPAIEDKASFFQNLKNAFAELLRKLRSMFSSGDMSSEQARNDLMDEILANEETYQMLVKAARAAASAQAEEAINETQDQINVASQATNLSSDDNIMNREDIESTLKENFDEYKEDETNLRIAADAIDALQHFRFSIGNNTAQRGNKRGPEQIRTIAKGITTQFLNEGYINFIGQKVNSPEDLACLCQVLRDPRFETFRIFLTKGNKIVSVQSVSSRLPGQSKIHKEKDIQTHYDVIKDRMQRTGADGYYLMHNHPSGNVGASMADLSMSAYAIQALGSSGYKGHIILDHDKFGLIEDIPTRYSNGMALPSAKEVAMIGQQTIDLIHEPEIDHQMLGEKISNPNDLARIGQSVNTSNDVSVLIYLSADRKVRGIQEISNKTIANNKEIKGYIRNQAVDFGSPAAALFTNSQDQNVERAVMDLYQQGVLLDAITGNVLGSLKTMRIAQVGDPRQMGITDADIFKRTKVYEPTEDTDIRFSLKEPVERVGDLIAVHNLSPDKLRGDIRLGGFPMPSIAVTNQRHEHFGEISLLFGSDTIDPQKDKANRVYSADAWTPTVPQTEYEANYELVSSIYHKIKDLVGDNKDLGYGMSGDLHYQSVESELKNWGGFDGLISRNMERPYMQYAFLKDTGKEIEIPYKEGKLQGQEADVWRELDKVIPELTTTEVYNMSYDEAMKYDPAIREILTNKFRERVGEEKFEKVKNIMPYAEPIAWGKVTNYLADLVKFREEGKVIQETDLQALRKTLDESIDKNEFRAWLNDLFDGVIVDQGVRNDKDPFTAAGNRRSFASLHYPATLDGILRAMKEQGEKNVSTYTSTKTLRADTAKSFRTLDEIISEEGKLQNLSEAEIEAISQEIDDKFYGIINSIGEKSSKKYDLYEADAIADIMSECAQKNYTEPEQIIKKYKEYRKDISEADANDILQLFDAIRNMPVNMFEAKPRRAVGFNEVKAAILPNDIESDIRSELELMEIPVYEYEANNEDDRQRVVNEAATEHDLRFSLAAKYDEDYMAAVESNDMETAQKLVDIAAREAGYNIKAYHGTTEDFNTFSRAKWGTEHKGYLEYGAGFYFTPSEEEAESWAKRGRSGYAGKDTKVMAVYLSSERAIKADDPIPGGSQALQNMGLGEADANFIAARTYRFINYLLEDKGFDNVEVQDELKSLGFDAVDATYGEWVGKPEGQFVVFDPTQIKSADTITYAEDGSVIPLSQRFDPTNDDIRYSLPTQDTNGKVLSDGQMEYFKNSQARGEGGKLVPVYHTTRMGGFTVFDPSKSDDKRSLFFASNWFVSQTYARNAYEPIDLNRNAEGRDVTLEEFINMDQEHGAPGLVVTRIIDIVDTETGEILHDHSDDFVGTGNALVEWYNAAREGKAKKNVGVTVGGELMDYESFSAWLNEMADEWYDRSRQRGYYTCYLNLVNPMIVDANFSYWNSIPYSPGASIEEVTEKLNHYAGYKFNRVSGNYQLNGSKYRLIVEGAKQDFATRTWTPFKIDEELSFDVDEVFKRGNTVNLQHALEDIWLREFGGKNYDHMELFFERLLDDLRTTKQIHWSSRLEERDFGGRYFTSDGFALYPVDYGYREKRYTTRQLAEIAQDQGYDGVIIRDCYDLSNASSFKGDSRLSDIFIAFSSNQIKDINNLDPTNNPDIRYSVVDDDEAMSYAAHDDAYDDSWEALEYYESVLSRMVDVDLDDGFINHPMQVFLENLRKYGETDAKARRGRDKSKYRETKFKNEEDWTEAFYAGLTWQASEMRFDDPVLEEGRTRMAKSRNDFFNSTVAKWNQGWVTDGSVLDINSIKKPVRDLVAATMQGSDTDRKYNSDTVKKTLIDMRLAYWYAQQGRIEIADALLWHTAHRMIENVEFYADDSVFNEYKDLRQYLRTTRIQLGEEYWADVDYQAFRKANFGRLKLVSGETNVDQIYAELEELFPGLFNSEEYTTPPDQLMHMAAVLDSIQPYKEAYSSEECAALATEIASDLLDIMQNEGKALESVADKYEAKIQAMRTRHAEAMLKVREQRDRGIKAEKARFKEYVAKQKERTLHKKHFQSIQNSYKKLAERLLTNTADKNIPEQYKKELAKVLAAFDLQTVGSKKYEARTGRESQKKIRMGAMIAALNNIEAKSGEFHLNDAITDIIDELLGADTGNGHNRSIEGLTIDELNSSELARIDNLLKALLHEFNTYKTVKVKAKRQQVEDIGKAQVNSALKHAEEFRPGKDYNSAIGILDKIVNLDEMTASYLFRRIDPTNEGMGLMYRELRRSFDHYVKNTAQLNQWMEQILGKYQNRGKGPRKYGSDEIDQWRSFHYTQTFNFENGTVRLTPAQMMSIYCLSKRPQAYNHMTGAGIVAAPNRYDANLISDIKQKANTALPVKLTDADIKQVVDALTPDQRKVAEDLQQLMANQMAAWGNEASMNVLGIELFGEPDYFPIKSDKAALISDLDENQFAEAIRSFGFTKAVQPGAKNAIMVDDIFTVVAEHCNNMNLYNSYSEAINDFMKVYNYRDVDESRGEYTVKQAIAHAYSQKATAFIGRFIKDLNGNVSGNDTGISKMYNDLLSKAKKASVFANGRVALQQPTAIARAFYVINPKYLKGIVTNEKAVQGAMQEMFDHCPIALWKSWGYYDIQMGRTVEDVMMNNGNWIEDLETDLYGRLDNITWTAIWQMVKAEMKDTHPDVKPGTDEYWELCNERMSEIVDLTQVVDSPMHRSHAMRAKDYVSKTATAFMSEPTLTFNMVKDGLIQAKEALQKGNKAKAGSIFAKTMGVFLLQAALVSAMAAIWDAVRGKNPSGDDDDDKSWFTLWWLNTLNNFKDELAIWNKVYFVKDISSLFQGYGVNNMALQGWKSIADGFAQLTGTRNVYSSKKWYENFLNGFGYVTGKPYGTLFKDLKAIYNMFGLDWAIFNSIGGYLDDTQNKFSEMFGKDDEDSMAAGFWAVFDGKKNGASSKEDEKESKSDKKKSSGSEEETAEDIKSLSEDQLKKLDKKAAEKAKGYTGPDRDEVLWDVLSEGYTKHIEAGDMDYIYKLRVLYQQHGGNIDTFNTKVANAMPSIYKKTFKANMTEEEISNQEEMKEFMLRYGMSEAEVSDICYHTDMAKDLKAALRMNNREYIMDELVPLIRAGLTREDFERLYKNRNRGANTYSGKYTDEKYRQSTGSYVWPTEGVITSGFGYRNAPTAGASSYHKGIDIGAAQGTPVVAVDGGTVIEAGSNGGYGNSVGIQHDDGTISYYNHLYNWNVQVGDQVGQGQQIGQVGSTGISTGPHLDFRLYKDGEYLNPEEYLNKRS